MAVTTTSSLSDAVRTMYEKTWLEALRDKFVFLDFTDEYPVDKGFGPVVTFRRWTALTADSARQGGSAGDVMNTLTEGTPPDENNLAVETLNVSVGQYGNFAKITDFLGATFINGYSKLINEAIDNLAHQAGDILDRVVRNAAVLASGSPVSLYGNGKSAGTITDADLATMADIRKLVRAHKKAFVPYYDGSNYVLVLNPSTSYDLLGESGSGSWMDANKYTSATPAHAGELGKMFSVRFVESNNVTSGSSNTITTTTGVFQNVFLGKAALGTVAIKDVTPGDRVEMKHVNIIIKDAGSAGTADPLNQLLTVGYKFNFAAVRLQASRVINYFSGATA